MSEERSTLVEYRLRRARESLAEADLLGEQHHLFGAINRLYYGCFYAVSALLLSHGLGSSKHTGVLSLFNHRFVKTGIVDRELGEVYNDLFRNRQRGDYEDLVEFSVEQLEAWSSGAHRLVDTIISLISDRSDDV